MVYRRARTLKNTLSSSNFNKGKYKNERQNSNAKTPNRGSFKCRHKKCNCCNNITNNATYIQSTDTKQTFNIK